MVKNVKKTFLRSPFKKEYGYYPFMFPIRLFSDTLGYNSLLLRRNLALLRIVFQLMRTAIACPTLLDRIGLNVPINFLRGRHHEYLTVPASRTNLYRTVPLPRAIRYINGIIAEVPECDVFHMIEGRLSEIVSSYLFRLHYQLWNGWKSGECQGKERHRIAIQWYNTMIRTLIYPPIYPTLYSINM
jgi:hypothetical protein